jgi:hypothetical protein
MSKQTGLPPDHDHVYGRPSNYTRGGRPDLAVKAGKPGGSHNSGGTGGSGSGGSVTKYISSTVTTTLNPNQNFQLMPDNPKRVYLAITAVQASITLAFGRAISSSDPQLEYSVGTTQTLFFETGKAPTGSVNVGSTDPNSAALIQVSILEGTAND